MIKEAARMAAFLFMGQKRSRHRAGSSSIIYPEKFTF
jgi:hypothetical protein